MLPAKWPLDAAYLLDLSAFFDVSNIPCERTLTRWPGKADACFAVQ
jgi:hypothetical protein